MATGTKNMLLEMFACAGLAAMLYFPLSWMTGETHWSAAIAAGAAILVIRTIARRRRHGN